MAVDALRAEERCGFVIEAAVISACAVCSGSRGFRSSSAEKTNYMKW